MKIVLITDIISPYRVPVFNAIAEQKHISLKVMALCQNMKGREWPFPQSEIKFDYCVLNNIQIARLNRPSFILNTGVIKNLKKYAPHIVICGGYYQLAYIQALFYCRRYKKKIIVWVESHEESLRKRCFFANMYRKWFLKKCDGYIVPGQKSCSFLINLGIQKKYIYTAPNAVDNNFFIEKSDLIRKNKEKIKHEKGYPDKIILYVGRIIREKGVYDLLDAYKNAALKNIGLIFVGEGKDENLLKKKVAKDSIDNVFFEGFKHLNDLPFYYGISDIFIFPTHRDEWGLVVNEACASGLPVASSTNCGVAYELVSEQNGAIFKKGDITSLTHIIKRILLDDEMREFMGKKSRELISGYSPKVCASRIIEASKNIKRY